MFHVILLLYREEKEKLEKRVKELEEQLEKQVEEEVEKRSKKHQNEIENLTKQLKAAEHKIEELKEGVYC